MALPTYAPTAPATPAVPGPASPPTSPGQSVADPTRQNKHGTEAQIDQVNQWMRQTPWYQAYMKAWGQDPGHPTLTKDQSRTLRQVAASQGVQITDDVEMDNHGNLNPKGHKLRNTLIVAGIAAATIATMGAAGAFSAAAAPGAAAATSGSTLAGINAAAIPSVAGSIAGAGGTGAAITAAGVPAIAGVAGGTTAATVGTTAAGIAASKAPSLWGRIAGTAIEAGIPAVAGVIGTRMKVNANKEAAAAEQAAAERALAWQKQVYQQRQTQLAPSIGVGNQATLRLGDLLGLKPPTGGYQPPPMPDENATTPPATAPAAPAAPTAPKPVLMRAPNGSFSMVDPAQVAHYQGLGATIVNA